MKQEIKNQIKKFDKKKKKELESKPILSDIEIQFKNEYEKITKQINFHLEKAYKELNKAQDIAEKHGIPFHANIREMHDLYVPDSFFSEWKNKGLDYDFLSEFGIYGSNSGWQQSQIC